MIDRIPSGFHPFVLPFLLGMFFVLAYCLYAFVRICRQLSKAERKKFFLSLIRPSVFVKNCWDIFCNCLLHVKLWKRNRLFGYMHSSIAFGWFMIIVLGHVEVFLFIPERASLFYYPIFFNFFVLKGELSLIGKLLFFLSDFFLLVIISGIFLAVLRRIRKRMYGVRQMARPSTMNRIGLYALWLIFPLRWLAETLTLHGFPLLFFWWAYSIALCVFLCVLPFTRYMHIPAEMILIPMRNAGLKIGDPRRGLSRVQVFSCPNCGVCIDACPMTADKANAVDCTVYLTRQLRRNDEARITEISDKCLLCGKCHEVCQVGVDGPELRIRERARRQYALTPDFNNIDVTSLSAPSAVKVAYFSGCMSQLTPAVGRSVESVMKKAGVEMQWIDRDGGLCCGRPLWTSGRLAEAEALVRKNEEVIRKSGADTLVLSCPICYRMFREKYDLQGIRIVYDVQFFNELIQQGRLSLEKTETRFVYHDPCELGRGCGMYEEPRELLSCLGELSEAEMNRGESVCCGGSLGSLSLDFAHRESITRAALENLYTSGAEVVATACPLCLWTFSRYADRPVKDIAQLLDMHSKKLKI